MEWVEHSLNSNQKSIFLFSIERIIFHSEKSAHTKDEATNDEKKEREKYSALKDKVAYTYHWTESWEKKMSEGTKWTSSKKNCDGEKEMKKKCEKSTTMKKWRHERMQRKKKNEL